jgi:threonylcarbamoyladenosine tRNA methylthiotransferase MtaB
MDKTRFQPPIAINSTPFLRCFTYFYVEQENFIQPIAFWTEKEYNDKHFDVTGGLCLTIAFLTLGCKVNQVDTEALRERMARAGFVRVGLEERPDVIVLNSCTVTAESERKTRQKLRHCKARNPACIMVLTGCAAQVSQDARNAYPEADIVLGHQDTSNLARYIAEYAVSHKKAIHVAAHQRNEIFANDFVGHANHTRASLKIEDGCDQFCSYCIVPKARGRVRSKPLQQVQQDIEILAAQGFQEIVLVGINLTAYGCDCNCSLSEVIALFENFSAIKRLRLGSLEPDGFTKQIAKSLLHSKSFCPHFHLSLQSGCDSVLKRMNRHYTTDEYFSMIKYIRSLFPDSSITTDVMIGFPGESDSEFIESMAFLHKVGFAKVHVFPFSARPGTAAYGFADQIVKAKKQARTREALLLAKELRQNFLATQVGKTLQVLLEDENARGMQGYAPNYAHVEVRGAGPELRNRIVSVLITGINEGSCIGEI